MQREGDRVKKKEYYLYIYISENKNKILYAESHFGKFDARVDIVYVYIFLQLIRRRYNYIRK